MTIIRQTQSLLNGMLERQESEFRQFGGIRERMHVARSAVRGQDWDKSIYSRLEGAGTVEELEARAAEVRRRLASAVASIKRRKGWDQ
jgi:four helix bundle suffix protein